MKVWKEGSQGRKEGRKSRKVVKEVRKEGSQGRKEKRKVVKEGR